LRLSEEEMAREIQRAKRFNTVAFIIVLVLSAVLILGFLFLDKKVTDRSLSVTFFISKIHA